jgi:hypothetical protein
MGHDCRKCLALLAALAAAPVSAQNIAINFDFNTDLANWNTNDNTPAEISAVWNSLDANGAPGSGSAQVDNISAGPNNGVTLLQCLPATAGLTYSFGGKIRVPAPGLGASDEATIDAYWTSDTNCLNNLSLSSTGFSPSLSDTWMDQPPTQVVAPAGTVAVKIRARITKFNAGGTLTALFDDVYLGPGTFPVTLQSFSVD